MIKSIPVGSFSFLSRILRVWVVILFGCLVLSTSSMPPTEQTERVRAFTRDIEFDYAGWMLNALRLQLFQFSLGTSSYLSADTRRQMVLEYLELVAQIQQTETQLNIVYADPNILDPQAASAELRGQLDELYARRERIGPVAEAILQSQISTVVDVLDITLGGQPIPPVLYHSTPLPLALIVSPRDVIRQEEDISLISDLTIDKRAELEEQVDSALDVSSLVVNIGGVGVYPTMVQESSALDWLSEVVAHEWVHNFLTLRPLGMNYLTSPELRVMNETTASIAGKEIGRAFLELFYPELVPPPPPPSSDGEAPGLPETPVFDFRAEMHLTRVKVDQLLEEGKIEEAEEYMEMRRRVFWEHGYRHLRKLNQAYFAFYGAYADEPGGAAGAQEDPIGAAVRALRAQSPSLAVFLTRMSWMSSFEELQAAVEDGSSY